MSVKQFLAETSREEMDDLEALAAVTPLTLGDVCEVLAFGLAAVASGTPIDPLDLLPWKKKKPVEQSGDDMLAVARGIVSGWNGV